MLQQCLENLAVVTKGKRVETISIAFENEVDGGRKKDVSNVTFDVRCDGDSIPTKTLLVAG